MMKMKSSKGNWTGRKGQLFLHLFLKYIYAYVNKSILKLNICVRLSVSVLLNYNCKINAKIQDVFHRPNLSPYCFIIIIRLMPIYKVYTIGRTWSWPVMSAAAC